MPQSQLAIRVSSPEQLTYAEKLAQQLNLPILSLQQDKQDFNFILELDQKCIRLINPAQPKQKPLFIDYCDKFFLKRMQSPHIYGEALVRACGIKVDRKPQIIDATAGYGYDSFLFAALGCTVTAIERNKILLVLLENALQCTAKHFPEIVQRIQLIPANAIEFLKQTIIKTDVVYLDPMFPEKNKTAASQKRMMWLRELVGADQDTDELFNLALQTALQRVVVKRPRHAKPLGQKNASYSLIGESCRLDVYIR